MFALGIIVISVLAAFCQSDVIPLKYNITINPNFQSLKFSANIIITIYVEASTQNITLNRKNLDIESVALRDQKNADIEGISFDVDNKAESLTIYSTSSLLNNEIYDVEIIYNGIINQNKAGFYAVKYLATATDERY